MQVGVGDKKTQRSTNSLSPIISEKWYWNMFCLIQLLERKWIILAHHVISYQCYMYQIVPAKELTTRKNKNDHQNQYVRIPKVLKKYDQQFWHLYIIISPISNLSCLLCKVFGVSRNFLVHLLFFLMKITIYLFIQKAVNQRLFAVTWFHGSLKYSICIDF